MKYELYIDFENFNAGNDAENYERKLVRLSDDLDELVNILNKYINKFMQIKRDRWQFFSASITDLSANSYDLEKLVYEISLKRKGTGA